jgi:hypothetical protein
MNQTTTPLPAPAPGTLPAGSALEQTAAVLRGVVTDLDVDTVPAADAAEWWRHLDEIDRLVSAGKLLLARRVDDSDAAQRAGLRSTADWLAQVAGTSQRNGQELLAASKRVAGLPDVEAAVRRGVVSSSQAGPIAHAAEADPAAQGELVEAAGVCSLRELLERCTQIRASSDPDPERTAERIRKARRLRLGRDAEGALCLFGRGPVEDGAELDTVLGVITDEIFHEAHAQGRHEPHEAYRWDALIEAVRRAWAHMHHTPTTPDATHPTGDPDPDTADPTGDPDPASGPPTGHPDPDPDAASPADEPRRGVADGAGQDRDHSDRPHRGTNPTDNTEPGTRPTRAPTAGRDPATPAEPALFPDPTSQRGRGGVGAPRVRKRRPGVNPWSRAVLRIDWEALVRGHVEDNETCDIPGIGPVPVSVARQRLGDSTLHLVLTKGGAVRNVTYLGRGPNAAQRIALLWEQPECSRLGCPRPARQIDHRDDYHRTRHTRLDELDPLCDHDHDRKTYEGWALVAGTGKRPMVPPGHPDHPGNPTYHPRPQPPPSSHSHPPGNSDPPSDDDLPTTAHHDPTGDGGPPGDGTGPSTTAHHDPTGDGGPPGSGDGERGPAGDRYPPTTSHRGPTDDRHSPSDGDREPPATGDPSTNGDGDCDLPGSRNHNPPSDSGPTDDHHLRPQPPRTTSDGNPTGDRTHPTYHPRPHPPTTRGGEPPGTGGLDQPRQPRAPAA